MSRFYILSAFGKDRPGIVADVTELLFECGYNLEDSSMTLLGTHFALLVMFSGEEEKLADRFIKGCKHLEWEKNLTVFMSPLEGMKENDFQAAGIEADYEIRVVGVDQAGIVYKTSQLLAENRVNIVGLQTRVEPAPISGSPVFTMSMSIVVPKETDRKILRQALDTLADQLRIDISMNKLPLSVGKS